MKGYRNKGISISIVWIPHNFFVSLNVLIKDWEVIKTCYRYFFKISMDMSFFTNFRIGKPRHARGFCSACLFLM